jgi:hypothetical protein
VHIGLNGDDARADAYQVALRITRRRWLTGGSALLAVVLTASLATSCQVPTVRKVGPGHAYAKPCQAIAAAVAGDIVEIDAAGNGTYDGDVCSWSKNNLTITGVNGRARIDAAGRNSGGKGIWVIAGNNTVIRNVELSGATVPDRNGAAIRQEGAGLTVQNSFFHDNENGILAGANPSSDITVQSSEFSRNGYGDGYSHNMYIGAVRSFTLIYSYSHDADVGHLVKSRAVTNYILYNRLTQQQGTGSYELNLPNAGLSYVIGNAVQQGSPSQNSTLVSYGEEGVTHPSSQLYLVNNTFVNDKGTGSVVRVGSQVTAPVLAQNNLSTGSPTFVNQPGASLVTNCVTANPMFVNRSGFDYRLMAGSPCLDVGSAPGLGGSFPLTPSMQYVYDLGNASRVVRGPAIDAGAFER